MTDSWLAFHAANHRGRIPSALAGALSSEISELAETQQMAGDIEAISNG